MITLLLGVDRTGYFLLAVIDGADICSVLHQTLSALLSGCPYSVVALSNCLATEIASTGVVFEDITTVVYRHCIKYYCIDYYLAVDECSTGDFVFVSMVIHVSLFGVVFCSGATPVASSSSTTLLMFSMTGLGIETF